MPICLDCIQAANSNTPCNGVEVTVSLASTGRIITVPATAVVNVNSLIGYDYVFAIDRDTFTITYTGSSWVVLNNFGDGQYSSVATGAANNVCPPTTGWTASTNRTFTSFGLSVSSDQGPSLTCLNTNGTFDNNSTGWTVVQGAYSTTYGGAVQFNTALLGSLSQTNVLTIGDTFVISFDYITSTRISACTPFEYSQAYIKVYAGTKVYTETLGDTGGSARNLQVELTCEGNTTLKIEVYDPSQCYGTAAGGKGRFIDNVCVYRTVSGGGGDPIVVIPYSEIAEVPLTLNGVDYNTKLAQYQNCLAQKGATFYNKVVGGVKCDYRELTKLKLITELLAQKDKDRALDCIYDRKDVVTATYEPIPCSVSGLTINTANPLVINGDYTPFETFTLQVVNLSNVVVASRKIIDVTFNSGTSQSTILLDSPFPQTYSGFNICLIQDEESTTTYLETFINFANRFCADCSVTPITTTSSTGSTTGISTGTEILATDLKSETGVDITTEFNQKITI
jgi:hypothetical protein